MFIKHLSAAAKSYRTYRLTLTSLAQACFAELAEFVPHRVESEVTVSADGEIWGSPGDAIRTKHA